MFQADHPPTALVTGASGAIGPVLVRRLVEAGYRVKALARRLPEPARFPAGVERLAGDITDPAALRLAMAGVDRVFHLAALLHIPNPSAQDAPRFEQVNVAGTRQVIEAAQAAGVARLVFFSTISVYGPSQGRAAFGEASPLNPQTPYARTKARAESLVLAARRPGTDQPLGVVLRLAAVYGAGIKGNYARLVTALQRRRFVPVGPGCNRRTLVHEQDVAAAALLAAAQPQAAGQVYNVTDGRTHTFQAILAAICAGLGQTPPRWHVPAGPVYWAMAGLEAGFRGLGRTPPLGRFTLDKLLEDVAVSGQKLQDELGFRPEFDLVRGWQVTLRAEL